MVNKMDVMSKDSRRKIMTSIRNKDTKIELLLRRELWREKIRYRKNLKWIIGKPDIVILKDKIAIFCDGDFWHGKNFYNKKFCINKEFWEEKIKRNMERDLEVTILLRDMGWTVIRFWESDIILDVHKCVEIVKKHLKYSEKT